MADNHTTCEVLSYKNRDAIGTASQTLLEVGADNAYTSKKKMPNSKKNAPELQSQAFIKRFTMPKLHTGKEWYVGLYCLDPAEGKMRRKKFKINHISKKKSELRKYAADLINRLYEELRRGWNPWVTFESEASYATFDIAVEAYRRHMAKLVEEDIMREKTYKGYSSMLNNFLKWKDSLKVQRGYIYQMNPELCHKFIDWLWLDQGKSSTTRDNYVIWMRHFVKFLLQKQYLDKDPTISVSLLGKKHRGKKNRTVIPAPHMARLKEYLEQTNKHFLLACYILYYCFVRPKEMSYIKIGDISVKNGTLFIPGQVSKNRKDGVVTLPDKVIKLMIELDVFEYPNSYYLFGRKMKPTKEYQSDKQLRDFWTHYVKKNLKFPPEYKFYSLKDTGITDLIRDNADLVSVRNQARHHSLLMTDIYTPHDIQEANEYIRHRQAEF